MFRLLKRISKEQRCFIALIWVLGLIIFGLHFWGEQQNIYKSGYIGYDKILHVLGGMLCGVFGLLVTHHVRTKTREPLSQASVETCIAYALFIGIVWEFYEYHMIYKVYDFMYIVDTGIDIIADMIGAAAIGWLIARVARRHEEKVTHTA